MKNITLILSIFLFGSVFLHSQDNDENIRQLVLKNNIKDSIYIFGKWNKIDEDETHLKYIGMIESPKGNYKIVTSIFFWGLSKRATSRILIFDEENNYLGNYYVNMTYNLPEKIINNELVFLYSNSEVCNEKVITSISFENGIPENFFLECDGDFISFQKE